MNRNGRGRCSVGRMAGNGLSSAGGGGERERGTDTKRGRTERRREAVTIYVKRRGKETNEKNDDGSPHSLLIVRSVGDGGSGGHIIHYHLQLRGRAAVAVPPSMTAEPGSLLTSISLTAARQGARSICSPWRR